MLTPSHDTPEGIVANLAQVLLVLLFIYPDATEIGIPRDWIAQWHRDLSHVLAQMRNTP